MFASSEYYQAGSSFSYVSIFNLLAAIALTVLGLASYFTTDKHDSEVPLTFPSLERVDLDLPLSYVNSDGDITHNVTVSPADGIVAPVSNHAINLNVFLSITITGLIWTVLATIKLFWKGLRDGFMARRICVYDWFSDGLVLSSLSALVSLLLGQRSLTTLMLQFFSVHAACVSFVLIEFMNPPDGGSGKPNTWPALLTLWVSIVVIVPLLATIASSNVQAIPVYCSAAIWILFAGWVQQSIVQWGYYSWLANPGSWNMIYSEKRSPASNYMRYSSLLNLLSTSVKLVIAFMIFGAFMSKEVTVTSVASFYPVSDIMKLQMTECMNDKFTEHPKWRDAYVGPTPNFNLDYSFGIHPLLTIDEAYSEGRDDTPIKEVYSGCVQTLYSPVGKF